jgi:hypothetical protein
MKFLFDDESFSFEALRTAGFALHQVMFDWLATTFTH